MNDGIGSSSLVLSVDIVLLHEGQETPLVAMLKGSLDQTGGSVWLY